MSHRIRNLAGMLAAVGLTGCIMLPPPPSPPPYGPPPPRAYFNAHRPPPPMPAWDVCDGQPEGARPALPGPRADAFAGTCERAPSGELQFRPSGPR